jgi:endonuclease III
MLRIIKLVKETKKARQERIGRIIAELDKKYGTQHRCFLNYKYDWQLLFAVILSAQCTDERVNMVTKDLFVKYKTLQDFAQAEVKEMERDIKSIGLYRAKSKNLILCAKRLAEVYDGKVPSDIDELTTLAGVGRKTANVIRGNIYNIPSIVVDTHVKRISKKLGLTESDEPVKVEYELMKILPKDHWILWNIDIITLGRTICIARREKCEECFLNKNCPSSKVQISENTVCETA